MANKILLFCLLIIPFYSYAFQNKTEYKLILFIDDQLIRDHEISNFKIKYLSKVIDANYELAEINYEISEEDKIELYKSGRVNFTFDYRDIEGNNLTNYSLYFDAKEFNSSYLIVRIYTRTKENKKKFLFRSNNFIYEYESQNGYALLPRKKGR